MRDDASDLTAVVVEAGTDDARALLAFLTRFRTPRLRRQFVVGWPHAVPRYWITEGRALLASKDAH